MVNYCCVHGCGRNQKTSSSLHFFCFPRERYRQIEWLQAIGRQDLASGNDVLIKQRICSRHFDPSCFNFKASGPKLLNVAFPTLHLPQQRDSLEDEPAKDKAVDPTDEVTEIDKNIHEDVKCDNCKEDVVGYRYKCLVCLDYDLCFKCERFGVHEEHCMLKISKPMVFKKVNDLVKNWQKFLKTQNLTPTLEKIPTDDSSDDDNIPITNFKKYDGVIDLSDEAKAKIREEVARVLSVKYEKPERKVKKPVKRTIDKCKNENKDSGKTDIQPATETTATESVGSEMVFTAVNYHNETREDVDVKPMYLLAMEPNSDAQLQTMRIHEELSEFMIVNP